MLLRDLVFLGEIHAANDLSGVASAGQLAIIAYLVVVGASIGALLIRYRWADE